MVATFFGFTFVQSSDQPGQTDPWVAPEKAKSLKNTQEYTEASVKGGAQVYKTRCVVCHGEAGEGDGPGAKALEPKPAALASDLVQDQVDGEEFADPDGE